MLTRQSFQKEKGDDNMISKNNEPLILMSYAYAYMQKTTVGGLVTQTDLI